MSRRRLIAFLFSLLLFSCAPAFAEKVALITNGNEALGARIAAIDNAKSEILISTFVMHNDEAVAAIHQALIRAAKRGVKVKYEVDGSMLWPNEYRDVLTVLAAHGVETRIVKQPGWDLLNFYNRQHDKLFLVDGKTMISGGRNHWNESFGLGPQPHHDTELLIEGGKPVEEARAYFYRTWDESSEKYLRLPLTAARQAAAEAHLQKAEDLRTTEGFDPEAYDRGRALKPTMTVPSLQFVWDHRRFREEGENHIDRLIPLIDSANETLVIEMPWLVMTDKVKRALTRAKRRGVKIEILTNSIQTAEVPQRDAVTRSSSRLFLQTLGVDLREFTGDRALHSKYILADGKRGYIGAYNLGIRSQYNNSETGFLFEDEALNKQIREVHQSRVRQSRPSPPYTWRDHPCWNFWASLLRPQF